VDARQPVTVLTGPWKFHTGDDMRWANPDFNDAAWDAPSNSIDLNAAPSSTDPLYGQGGYVTGWTAHGYPGYFGYAWYRLSFDLRNAPHGDGQPLAIKMPSDFDDSYQLYVNGRLVGQFGLFRANGVKTYAPMPRAFPLPASLLEDGPVTIAIRMWMHADLLANYPDQGGLHGPPMLGQVSVIEPLLRLDWYILSRYATIFFLVSFIALLSSLGAFALFALDRSEPAYLWLALACAAGSLGEGLHGLVDVVTWVTWDDSEMLVFAILPTLGIALWVIFWGYWFRYEPMRRLHRIVWPLALLLTIGLCLRLWPFFGVLVPVHAIVWLRPSTVLVRLLFAVLLIWLTVVGIRRNRTEGLLALPAVLLLIVSEYQTELLTLHLRVNFFPLGVRVSLSIFAILLSLAMISLLLMRRFTLTQRHREQLRQELEQARQLQQMLIPEDLHSIPGFSIATVYNPAGQVGGDFFQILPTSSGGVLLIMGDVSGKGLRAAMQVSMIVGVIRAMAAMTTDPLHILAGLNARLCERSSGGFTTCLILHADAEGKIDLANAGHLAPYINGREVELPGSVPLGIAADIEYSRQTIMLAPGEALTLLSDGVVEAQNSAGELFGFDRTREISGQSAQSIAEAAQLFGQVDDITVLTLSFVPAGVLHA
jgi:hypothetical protein